MGGFGYYGLCLGGIMMSFLVFFELLFIRNSIEKNECKSMFYF